MAKSRYPAGTVFVLVHVNPIEHTVDVYTNEKAAKQALVSLINRVYDNDTGSRWGRGMGFEGLVEKFNKALETFPDHGQQFVMLVNRQPMDEPLISMYAIQKRYDKLPKKTKQHIQENAQAILNKR